MHLSRGKHESISRVPKNVAAGINTLCELYDYDM